MMRKLLLALMMFLALRQYAVAQNDPCGLRISLLTCGPGEDLYSLFGHSGLRVYDSASRRDIVYNYGTFDFSEDFYFEFVKGKLLYAVTAETFEDFMYGYRMEHRSVAEQILQLDCAAKNRLSDALRNNARPENRQYLYHFFFDNCSTRPRDIVVANAGGPVQFKEIVPDPHPSFRNLIHEYLNRGKQYWSKFGIDLLLGSRIDRPVTNTEAMFLPDYLMKGFDSATVAGTPLVASKKTVFDGNQQQEPEAATVTPLMLTLALLLIFGLLSCLPRRSVQTVLDAFDTLFFLILGLLGVVMLIMWFFTDHDLCASNYNVLWAMPTHLVIAFVLTKRWAWVRKYFVVIAIIYALLILSWGFLPQQFNTAFLPLAVLAGLRSAVRAFKK